MSMGVFYHEKRKREFVISMILDGGGMIDGRPRTADGGGGGFPVCEEEQTVNEWGTADGKPRSGQRRGRLSSL
jgi:hypothetical protein